jgi:hypothetical protein
MVHASISILAAQASEAARSVLVILYVSLIGAGLAAVPNQVQAQDTPQTAARAAKVVKTLSGPRSSPFNPPDKDVFLTDASPGLDTGCTFNTSPLNPLKIDIAVDRFVGEVDANGFLVDPAPLISGGIIPANVEVILPAYDVDFNGTPPPERDEVFFNGQSLGFLTGDNNVWKLNSFRIDIRKVKFPARPVPGSQPTPVNNRLQINIDTLGTGRWCTQADWVAILLPIRPNLALDLEVISGNPVRSDDGARLIKKIQEQAFDAKCNVTTTIGPIEDYPFSGAALTATDGPGSAKLKAKIKACPEGSLKSPEVTAKWSVEGTPRQGTLTFSGLEKEIEFSMPQAVGAYTVGLKLMLDNGQVLDATRRLYVTRKTPGAAAGEPRIHWYKKGTEWASGEIGETQIIEKVLGGLYAYGGTRWIYAEDGPRICRWDELMNKPPLACAAANCYVFSDVLQNISGALGVSGLIPVRVLGANAPAPFLTAASPSLDPAWPGNARLLGTSTYDRYVFGSHSLRERGGLFYDATFRGIYSSQRQFITANSTGNVFSDANGLYESTDEGAKIYPRADSGYRGWGTNDYTLPTARMSMLRVASNPVGAVPVVPNPLLSFAGIAALRTPDTNRDARAESLDADIDVDVLAAGSYVVVGQLQSASGQVIANRPKFNSMQSTRANFSVATPGRVRITLRFSGEQIRQARTDGSYQLVMFANGQTQAAGSGSFATPAYRWVDFGELPAQLRSLQATPLDTDGSGRFDTLNLAVEVEASNSGVYQIGTSVLAGNTGLIASNRLIMLDAGVQVVSLNLPTTTISSAGIDAPYQVAVNLADSTGTNLDGTQTALVGLLASQFEGVVTVAQDLTEQLIDSNANALADLLRVGVDARTRSARAAIVRGVLVAVNGASVSVDVGANMMPVAGPRINLDFSGPLIRSQQMSSAYRLELSFRDPATLEEFDSAVVPLRGAYVYSAFDPAEPPRAIALNGQQSDRGIDTNTNGLFDRLQVDLGVDLLASGTYDWSGRLVDRNGQELGFASGRGTLPIGSTSVRLEFDGRAIGVNGLDGPFFIRSLLMSSASGANLVAPFAGQTSAWRANQFEGFVVRAPADLNGDGRVDAADIDAFNRALGSSLGEPTYNRFADYDRDGRITLNDLRYFRSYLPRQ